MNVFWIVLPLFFITFFSAAQAVVAILDLWDRFPPSGTALRRKIPRKPFIIIMSSICLVSLALAIITMLNSTPSSSSASQLAPPPTLPLTQSNDTPVSLVSPTPSPTATPLPTVTTAPPQPSTTSTTPSQCPYTDTASQTYPNDARNIPINVSVPQGCYLIASIYNGSYTSPDQFGIPGGSLLAFQGPITITATLSGGGGLIGFSNKAKAKSFYCNALHSGNTYGITKSPHSLDWASTC